MSSPQPEAFGSWLKRLRAQHDLTQDALAEQVGCAVYTIRTYEMGTRRPARPMAERLADVLQLPAEDRAAFLRAARAPLGAAMQPARARSPEADVADERPPGRAPRQPARIPAPLTALVGRATELADLDARLRDPACRLLTLLGPGGVGKTRLALQLAANLARDPAFDHEVVWVELAALPTADYLPAAVCEALGAPVSGAIAPDAQLLATLGERRVLLILDNFEHLLDASPLLSTILRSCVEVRILVTSRERVRVQGAAVYELQGLALPPADAPATAGSAAALLFLERARQVDHRFALNAENAVAVARICRLLAGMPLGIELAATWVRFLPCAEIAREIEGSLDFLVLEHDGVPPRQQSLRAVFDHSWQLLAPLERQALARLSVLRGSWNREAAVAVAGATMPLLAALIDASLAHRVSSGSDGRYALHELVRQYAAEQLQADSHAYTTTVARHAAFFATRLHDQAPALQSQQQAEALEHLRPDLDNVWQAWEWAVEQPDPATLHQMARGVVTLCEDLGSLQDGARRFGAAEAALAGVGARDSATTTAHGEMLMHHGYFLGRCGRPVEGERRLQAALTLLPEQSAAARGQALTHLALLTYQQGKFAEADGWAQEAITALRGVEDQFYLGLATCFAGMTALAQGNEREAEARLAESWAVWQRNGYPRGRALVLCAQSELAQARALELAREAIEICVANGDRWGLSLALSTTGVAALALGEVVEARRLCAEAAEIARELGEWWGLCRALLGGGWALIATSEHGAAADVFREVARLGRESAFVPQLLHALLGLGVVAVHANDERTASLCLAAVCQHAATEQLVRKQAEAQWACHAARLDEQVVRTYWKTAADTRLMEIVDQVVRPLQQAYNQQE